MQPVRHASRRAIAGWVLFDWAAQPFFTLVTTFVYAPYFAVRDRGRPGRGTGAVGLRDRGAPASSSRCCRRCSARSPMRRDGASRGSRRSARCWSSASCVLWFGRPGDAAVIPLIVLVAFAIGTIGVEFATVFNNAMMPTLVPPERLGRLSGTGWAIGYVGGLVSLIIVLGFLAANPQTGKTLLGFTPLFGLDPALREGDRAAGPLTALWFVVFVLPLFLFTPDGRAACRSRAAVGRGARDARRHAAQPAAAPQHRAASCSPT